MSTLEKLTTLNVKNLLPVKNLILLVILFIIKLYAQNIFVTFKQFTK